jgi:dienelactone hydrolase
VDGFGIQPIMRDIDQRLAERGSMALLPGLGYRIGRCPLMNRRQVLAGLRLVNALTDAAANSVVSLLK